MRYINVCLCGMVLELYYSMGEMVQSICNGQTLRQLPRTLAPWYSHPCSPPSEWGGSRASNK